MDISFIATVVLISLTGVMAPGPLFAATIAEGRKNKFAGILISFGHAAVEIPIILLLFFFGTIVATDFIKAVVGILGGIVLLYLAYLEVRSSSNLDSNVEGVLAGIIMSSCNPYFIMWWFTVGFTLIMRSIEFGILGLVAFVILHELCDFSWLTFVSLTSNKASTIWGERAQKVLTAISVTIFVIFGIWFLITGITTLL